MADDRSIVNVVRIGARFELTGVVQGVGFRPWVHRLATELGLDGHVGNDSTELFVEVHGPPDRIDELERRIVVEAPPLAVVESVTRHPVSDAVPVGSGFAIVASRDVDGGRTLVSPDVAVCDRCVAELFDPTDRRFGHPFITCTDCGPRFTIITGVPYDRPSTTMARFDMCPACRAEYDDPTSRRHHAQPIACHDCGPRLRTRSGAADAAAITATVLAIGRGEVVAIKGLGGFHLACDAGSDGAVGLLRRRKHRPDKPFALMVRDLAAAREIAEIGDDEAALLVSPARPVVLLRARTTSVVSDLVAPGNPLVGIMLPYTPIHHLLFAAGVGPLVMTSGNVAGEPICHRDDEVDDRLGPLVDDVVTHDRPICAPCDDSVVRIVDGRLLPIRRARGYAPLPVRLTDPRRCVLAVGGELKNTCCVTTSTHAFVSQHLGDMENQPTIDAFEATVDRMLAFWGVRPTLVAADAHPGYASSRWAERRRSPDVVAVQHHHAHVAAVMAEHGLDPAVPVLGFAFDGTGFGTDGAIWGGEVLVATAASFTRVTHLAPVPLPGGDAAVRHPARVALSHLRAAGVAWTDELAPVAALTTDERRLLARMLDSGVQCVPTTSMGRLFDAVASLLGLRHEISYEAQAAIDLEIAAAAWSGPAPSLRFAVSGGAFDAAPVIAGLCDGIGRGEPVAALARAFHDAVAVLLADLAQRLVDDLDIENVVLSGGVFQNALLVRLALDAMTGAGVGVLTHRLVPPNDGGLALGQAYIAAHRPERQEN